MLTHEERIALALELNKKIAAGGTAGIIATRDKLAAGELSSAEVSSLVSIYPKWAVGLAVKAGELYAYGVKLYKVVQAHTTQADWLPDITPALFTEVAPAGTIPAWKQPTGAQDSYSIGDEVMFEGHVYRSKINGNAYSPTEYPAGWELIS